MLAKTVHCLLLKSLETETEKLVLIRMIDWLLENMVVYLYWSREYRKIQIRLRLTVVRSGGIVLPGVYLLLHYVCPSNVDTPMQNTTWFELSSISCAATSPPPTNDNVSYIIFTIGLHSFFCYTYGRTTSVVVFMCGCESSASAGLLFRCRVKRRSLVKPVQMLRDVFDSGGGYLSIRCRRSMHGRCGVVGLRSSSVWRTEAMPMDFSLAASLLARSSSQIPPSPACVDRRRGVEVRWKRKVRAWFLIWCTTLCLILSLPKEWTSRIRKFNEMSVIPQLTDDCFARYSLSRARVSYCW